ncbi:MAG: TlpA disulfide reductase family protein [Anaerolineales bacterium]|nr:TlpA disulfide reductase family protein [Anaerolineales bacterium]
MTERTGFQKAILVVTVGAALLALCVAAMTILTLRQSQASRKFSATPVIVEYPAPALTLNDLNEEEHSLRDYAGQVVLVNFWASWCQPCLDEMPALETFFQQHKVDGFVVLGINNGESLSEMESFLDDLSLSFPIWLDPQFLGEGAFGVTNLPSSFLIDRRGQVRLQWLGAIELSTLEEVVVPIINE